MYRKAVKKGFEFTLMVAGESGMGKSTLINSMFLTDIYSAEYPGPSARIKKTVKVSLLLKYCNIFLVFISPQCFSKSSKCWALVLRMYLLLVVNLLSSTQFDVCHASTLIYLFGYFSSGRHE